MKEQKRYLLIDGIRGLAIVNMVAFHFLYDVNEIWNINSHWYEEKSIHIWPQPLFTFQEKQLFLLIHTEEADSPTQLKK